MTTTLTTMLLTSGIVCLIAAIVGGGLKAFQIELPLLQSVRRQILLAVLGASFITAVALPPLLEVVSRSLTVGSSTDAGNASPSKLQSRFGYIYLGMRGGGKWITNQFAYGPIIASDAVPQNGDVVMISQSVHLRKGVPPAQEHLVMRDDLGIINPGTMVRIKTVTRLDPEGFYWASVDVLGSDTSNE